MQNKNNNSESNKTKEVQVMVRPTLKLNLPSKSLGMLQNKMKQLNTSAKPVEVEEKKIKSKPKKKASQKEQSSNNKTNNDIKHKTQPNGDNENSDNSVPKIAKDEVKTKATKRETKEEYTRPKQKNNKNTDTDNNNEVKEYTTKPKDEKNKKSNAEKSKKWLLEPWVFKSMLKDFEENFPNCFMNERKPLGLKVRNQLKSARPELSHKTIGSFLSIYCRSKAYKEKLILGAERLDLNGEVSSFVTEEQIEKGKWMRKPKIEGENKENNAIKIES